MDLATFCGKYLDFADRFSKKVYEEKRAVCHRMLKMWGPDIIITQITPEMAESYLKGQKSRRSANSSNKDRKNLLAMWNWGVKILELEKNPFSLTLNYPHDRNPQYVPPPEDVLQLLMVADRKERVLLDVVLQTAARRSSVFRLMWHEDINFEKHKIRIGTKKTKDGSIKYHWLDMSDELYDSLTWWWKNRTFKSSPYVFVNDHPGPYYGKPYTERRRFMNGLCRRAGIKNNFGFHALRRFMASVLSDFHKVSLKKIQYILGHASLRTTEKYVFNVDADLKAVMNLPKIVLNKELKDRAEKAKI